MKKSKSEDQSLAADFVPVKVHFNMSYTAGETASYFFTSLRDQCCILGTKCPQCARILVPARQFCSRCFISTTDWIEVGPCGYIVSYSIIHNLAPHYPKEVPFAYCIIRLDGADTDFVHLLGEYDNKTVHNGMRVEAVFADDRKAGIFDIAYFRPIPS